MRLKLLMLLTIIFLSIGDIGTNNSATYRALIDGYHGFYKVVIAGGGSVLYENNTFNINVGDNIIWINDDPSDAITVINDQRLWENDTATLKYYGRQFNYTFNKSGIYTFYIKQYSAFPKQTVIVSDILTDNNITINTGNTNTTINTTVVPTPTIYPTIDTSNTNTTINTIVVPTPTIDISPGVVVTERNDDTNIINLSENTILYNPFFTPLNISKNFKKMVPISFIIVMIIFLIRKENGEK